MNGTPVLSSGVNLTTSIFTRSILKLFRQPICFYRQAQKYLAEELQSIQNRGLGIIAIPRTSRSTLEDRCSRNRCSRNSFVSLTSFNSFASLTQFTQLTRIAPFVHKNRSIARRCRKQKSEKEVSEMSAFPILHYTKLLYKIDTKVEVENIKLN